MEFLSLEPFKTRQGSEQLALIDPSLRRVVTLKDLQRWLLTPTILSFGTIWEERERNLDPSETSFSQLNLSKSEERTQDAFKIQDAPNMNCCLSFTITPKSSFLLVNLLAPHLSDSQFFPIRYGSIISTQLYLSFGSICNITFPNLQ